MSEFPSFELFYEAVHGGRVPFPWQSRLAAQVLDRGWPDTIAVPTGLGKTACIDIAVWTLAADAAEAPTGRRLPTRTWYVVNRRLLVDAAHTHGEHLTTVLADPDQLRKVWSASAEHIDAVAAVAERLASVAAFGTTAGPLHLTRLRGGAAIGVRSPDPSQPTVVFATVGMFASRWLFRGYGSSTSMRPVDAAHAGIDTLVLLDEAHLSRPLVRLAATVAAADVGDPTVVLPAERARPRLVALTATADDTGERFDLDATDRAHPVIARRLAAAKPTQLHPTTVRDLPLVLADTAGDAAAKDPASATLVFANTPATARAVTTRLGQRHPDCDVMLLTGRTREREASRLRDRILDPDLGIPADRDPAQRRDRPLVVVATQTLEVGADVDADHLVTETAGVRALIQRFGRLNRLGHRPHASAVIVHPVDRPVDKTTGQPWWPVYGSEPAEVWTRLTSQTTSLDLGPARITAVLGPPLDEPPRTGELLPDHLWEWAKTSHPSPGEAPPELFFDGFADTTATVAVAWRAELPVDGARLDPPLRDAEAIDVPVYELRAACEARNLDSVARLTPDRASVERVAPDRLRPGDQVLLAVTDGFYDHHGWNPDANEVVLDTALVDQRILPLDAEPLARLLGHHHCPTHLHVLLTPFDVHPDDDDYDPMAERAAVDTLLAALHDEPPHPWLDDAEWRTYLDAVDRIVTRRPDGPPRLQARPEPRFAAGPRVRLEAFEDLSFTATSEQLGDHVGAVGETAGRIATHLGCPPAVVEAVRFAGTSHDLGKADPRFQRWLDPTGSATGLLAKSTRRPSDVAGARTAAGWPQGGRHELLSTRLAAAWLAAHPPSWDAALALHLIATHHGGGRPLVAAVDDSAPTAVAATINGDRTVVSGDLSRPDWDQPARFRAACERYGLWGLALLEACVRQADHAVSSVIEVA